MSDSYSLVTGAAGFIGSQLTNELLRQGHNVLAIDCFLPDLYAIEPKKSNWNNLISIGDSDLIKVEFDMRNDDFTSLPRVTIKNIFNEAAMPGLSSNWLQSKIYYECNVYALNRLLEFARKQPLNSFVHASTSSVYGTHAIGNENQELKPISPYGVSKLAAEKLIQAYFLQFGLPYKILRYFSVYGPGQRPDMAYSKIIRNLLTDTPFTIYGSGLARRSNTFVSDVVQATIMASEKGKLGEIYNISGGQVATLLEIVSILEKLANKELRIVKGESRKGDQAETQGDSTKALKDFNWQASTPLHIGLEKQFAAAISYN